MNAPTVDPNYIPETLHGLVRARCLTHPSENNEEVAAAVLDEAQERDDFAALLVPLLVHQVANVRRKLVREAEEAIFAGLVAQPVSSASEGAGHMSFDAHERIAGALAEAEATDHSARETHQAAERPSASAATRQDVLDIQTMRAGAAQVDSEEGDHRPIDTHGASVAPFEPLVTPLSLRRDFLAQTFAIKGVGKVAWGAATVVQHRQRIEQLRTHAHGVALTVAKHVRAIRAIEAAPAARCLNDLLLPQALEVHNV